jgi:hypothetical protein
MAVTQLNKLDIVSKRLDGRTHTSPVLATPSETISSTVQLGGQSIFVDQLPTDSQIPTTAPAIYTLYSQSLAGKPVLEYVRFQLTAVGTGNYPYTAPADLANTTIEQQGETNVASTNHTYALRLTGSYESVSNSSNPKKGTVPYTNNYHLTGSGFGLQIVPSAFGVNYTPRLYSGSTEIPFSDPSDWVVDCAAGILWIQDPTAFAAGSSTVPTHVDAYLYIGDYAATTIAALSASLQSVAATNAYATMSVGGVAVIADTATGTLTIASGSFGGAATTNNNLLISASAGNDTITFSLVDSPRFTHITASGNISSSGNLSVTGNSTIGGNLSVDGNTTLGNAAADTASINAGRVNISNLPVGSSELTVLVTGSGGQVFTRQLAASAFSGGSGVSGSGAADRLVLWSGTNSVNDDAELSFNRGTNVLTIGSSTFGNDTNISNNLIVGGDLTVNGETTIINTTNLSIEDKFIVLGRSSGSQTPIAEGGIIIEGAGGSGSAFLFNSGSGTGVSNRWGIATNVPTGSTNVTPTDFMVSVSSSGAAPTAAPTYGGANGGFGNMYVQSDGEIWIYS